MNFFHSAQRSNFQNYFCERARPLQYVFWYKSLKKARGAHERRDEEARAEASDRRDGADRVEVRLEEAAFGGEGVRRRAPETSRTPGSDFTRIFTEKTVS